LQRRKKDIDARGRVGMAGMVCSITSETCATWRRWRAVVRQSLAGLWPLLNQKEIQACLQAVEEALESRYSGNRKRLRGSEQ
jgi:hypothetical protein